LSQDHLNRIPNSYLEPLITTNPSAAKITGANTSDKTSLHDIPPPSPCSTCSTTTPQDLFYLEATESTSSATSSSSDWDPLSDIDNSDLGEFLLDALDGFDPALAVDSAYLCN
jgi:hypothetical protein